MCIPNRQNRNEGCSPKTDTFTETGESLPPEACFIQKTHKSIPRGTKVIKTASGALEASQWQYWPVTFQNSTSTTWEERCLLTRKEGAGGYYMHLQQALWQAKAAELGEERKVQGQKATKQLRWDSEAGLLNLKSPKFWATEKTEEMNSGEFLRVGQAQSLTESSGSSGHMLKLCDGHGKRKLSCSSKLFINCVALIDTGLPSS